MGAEPVFVEIMRRLDRAVANGTRLHLDLEHARALLDPAVYIPLTVKKTEELKKLWESAIPPAPTPAANDSRSENSGSGIDPIEMTGTSAGSKVVQLAAEEQVSEAVEAIRRRKRPRRH